MKLFSVKFASYYRGGKDAAKQAITTKTNEGYNRATAAVAAMNQKKLAKTTVF